MLNIQSFSIRGLHEHKNLSANFKNNTGILIGDNGIGKSTFLQALFYVLTKNWRSLSEIDFHEVVLKYEGGSLSLTKNQLVEEFFGMDVDELGRMLPKSYETRLLNSLGRLNKTDLDDADYRDLSESTGIPLRIVKQYIKLRYSSIYPDQSSSVAQSIYKFEKLIDFDVLYFPTYRKVETDLSSLLRGAPQETIDRTKRFIDQRKDGEILGFGMEDVRSMLENKTNELSRDFNESVTNLMNGFLVKIINEEHKNTYKTRYISPTELSKIMSRTGSNIIPIKTRTKIEELVQRPKSELQEDDAIILYFVDQMIDVYNAQTKKEFGVNLFVEKCNKYFSGKKIDFNTTAFTVEVKSTIREAGKIEWQNLSSGEKQVASIFSRLYLKETRCFVLIDEPELSLSIEWQQMLLPDIADAKNCLGVIAVTHSPFIFQNEMDIYAGDFKISSYRKKSNG